MTVATGPEESTAAPASPRNPFTWLLIGAVRGYQLIVSPWIAPRCKYYPSCSAYAVTALRTHGALRGTRLAVWRLLRCNPWSLGGVDHVPPARDAHVGRHRDHTHDLTSTSAASVASGVPTHQESL